MARTFTITELSQEFGVTPRAIRFYEHEGLIQPERQGQARIYSPGDRVRLKLILRGRRLGFSLADIKDLLDLYRSPDGGRIQVARTLERVEARIAELERQRRDITETLDELGHYETQLRDHLARLDQAGSDRPPTRAASSHGPT